MRPCSSARFFALGPRVLRRFAAARQRPDTSGRFRLDDLEER
jgi:hypothetical protein